MPAFDPICSTSTSAPAVTKVIDSRVRDLGGFSVRRVLPSAALRMVGPFTFFDHMGPAVFAPGAGLDVRPHPHIGLATVTYLFEGEILHRDNLGSRQSIRPGDVNWMTAGRGIVHSERTPPELRTRTSGLHGIQLWVALPLAHEEVEPSFHHHPGATLPQEDRAGVRLRVLAGSACGMTAPIETLSPLFYVDAVMSPDAVLPLPDGYDERALYVVEGAVLCENERADAGRMLVFAKGSEATFRAEGPTRVVLIGGAALEGQRHIDWNFVSSSTERIGQARRDWIDRNVKRFPAVPGDDVEFIPLP